jgi:hypothetical protein
MAPAAAPAAPLYDVLDEALAELAPFGSELANGLTSHAPMVVEALCALDRPDAVLPWLERYRAGCLPRAPRRERIDPARWRDALARTEREEDWALFFAEELREAPWTDVLRRWAPRLAPGLAGAATHGVIRAGHAVRSLDRGASPERVRELADALALFAASYQELPGGRAVRDALDAAEEDRAGKGAAAGLAAADALASVERVPLEARRFRGTIVSSLEALDEFPPFARAIHLLAVDGDLSARLSDLTDAFARVFLANARNALGAIVFAHAVTSVAALRSLAPHLDDRSARRALRFAWEAGAALYAAFGERAAPVSEPARDAEAPTALAARAVEHGDEHAIKFTEACLREDALRPSPAYRAAVRLALELLPRERA